MLVGDETPEGKHMLWSSLGRGSALGRCGLGTGRPPAGPVCLRRLPSRVSCRESERLVRGLPREQRLRHAGRWTHPLPFCTILPGLQNVTLWRQSVVTAASGEKQNSRQASPETVQNEGMVEFRCYRLVLPFKMFHKTSL